MKKKFLNGSMGLIKKGNPQMSQDQLDIIAYGLESIYLTFTKSVVIFGLAFALGIAKEVIILLLCYNVIRSTAFGLHASKSIYCLLSSVTFFVGGALLCNYLSINIWAKVAISIACVVCIFKYAPADTIKRPLINAGKRKKYKIISTFSSIVFTILIIVFHDNVISNFLLLGMIEEVLMILPLVYKLFHLSYDNYKNYATENL